jgi:hypothetical protein
MMDTVDWVILWIGAAMIAAGAFGWFWTLRKAQGSGSATGTRSINPTEYIKALKDVPTVNLLIGLGFLLILLAAGWVEISIAGG